MVVEAWVLRKLGLYWCLMAQILASSPHQSNMYEARILAIYTPILPSLILVLIIFLTVPKVSEFTLWERPESHDMTGEGEDQMLLPHDRVNSQHLVLQS